MSAAGTLQIKQDATELRVESGAKITAAGTQAAAIASLTLTGATANNALELCDSASLANLAASADRNFADVATKLNLVLAALRGIGAIAP